MKRVAVFVDVSNLYYTLGSRKLNYAAYLDKAIGRDELIKAVAYGCQQANEAKPFINMLQSFGFETKYKNVKVFHAGTPRQTHTADWDVGIAMDIVRFLTDNEVDRIVLGSADSDMAPLVEWIVDQGIECHIYACDISRDLIRVATSVSEIRDDVLMAPELVG